MDCATSLALLSDFHDGLLNEVDSEQVRLHLVNCPPCDGVFSELKIIITTAAELREESTIPFLKETAIWQLITIGEGKVR